MTNHPAENEERAQEVVRQVARRRRTGFHLSVTASWWRNRDGETFSGSYHLTIQADLGAALRTEALGAWTEACDHRECHLMTASVLASEQLLHTGRGPNGTEKMPSPTHERVLWDHLLQGKAAAEWRLALPPFSSGQFLDSASAGLSLTEFTRYDGGVPQTEVLLHSMASPSRQWVPEQIGVGTDPACEHVWCRMAALNEVSGAWFLASPARPAHADAVGALLELGVGEL